jgi:YD repeat-containing protein
MRVVNPDATYLQYGYDANGNMTLRVDKSSGDSTKYTWDIENRLVKVEMPGTVVEYVYGPLGRRLAKVVNGCLLYVRAGDRSASADEPERERLLLPGGWVGEYHGYHQQYRRSLAGVQILGVRRHCGGDG